jgi:DNA-binding transcriptional LysR family regulator
VISWHVGHRTLNISPDGYRNLCIYGGHALNFNKLKYFVSAAELGSFTKAAENSYISQTAITQQMQALEDELGFPLFYRHHNGITLTAAGEIFHKSAVSILSEYDNALKSARNVNEQVEKNLFLAVTDANEPFIIRVMAEFEKKYPDIRIKIVSSYLSNQCELLCSDKVDVAVGLSYEFAGIPELDYLQLYSQEVGVLVSRDNPLSKFDSVYVSDLIDQTWIMLSRDAGPKSYDHLQYYGRMRNLKFREIREAPTMDAIILMVSANIGVAFFPLFVQHDRKHCKVVRVQDLGDYLETGIAWKKSNRHKKVERFITVCSESLKSEQDSRNSNME